MRLNLSKPQFIIIIIILGFVIRLISLGSESLWLDEGYSAVLSKKSPTSIISELRNDAHPPLYYFTLHYWITIFGDSPFSIRFPSVIFGTAAIYLIYLIGKRYSEKAALSSAAILAFSWFSFWYSQEARSYSMLMFLSLLSYYAFDKEKKTIYTLSTAAMLYTHYYGFFIIFMQGLYSLFYKKKMLPLLFGPVILFIPWIPMFYKQLTFTGATAWIDTRSPLKLVEMLALWSGNIIMLPIFIMTLKKEKFTTFWMSMPVLPYIISFVKPLFLLRGTIASVPAFYLAASRKMNKYYLFIFISASLLLIGSSYINTEKEEWKQAIDYTGDYVVLNPGIVDFMFEYYGSDAKLHKVREDTSPVDREDILKLQARVFRKHELWLLESHENDPDNLIKNKLDKIFMLEEIKKFNGITVYHYKKE